MKQTVGTKGEGQRWGELGFGQCRSYSKVSDSDACQLKSRENLRDDLNPIFCIYRREIITHRWWLTQGQSCQSEAELELKNSDLLATSLLLFPLSTSLLYTYRTWGIKALTNSSVLKQPWKAPQSPGLSITCWQCQQKRQEIRPLVITLFLRESFGLPIGFAGLETYGHRLFFCQEEVWWDQAQAWRFHGLKACSTRIIAPLTFPAYPLPPLAIAKEMKSPLDTWLCDFLIPMSVQRWRIQGEAKTREPT